MCSSETYVKRSRANESVMPQVLAAFVDSLTADSDVRMVERHIEWERLVQAEREALAAAASSRPADPTSGPPEEPPSQQRGEKQQTALVRGRLACQAMTY